LPPHDRDVTQAWALWTLMWVASGAFQIRVCCGCGRSAWASFRISSLGQNSMPREWINFVRFYVGFRGSGQRVIACVRVIYGGDPSALRNIPMDLLCSGGPFHGSSSFSPSHISRAAPRCLSNHRHKITINATCHTRSFYLIASHCLD